jgi:hypothetical protein
MVVPCLPQGLQQGTVAVLVHTATAPNAVLHTLPVLPTSLWAPSLSAVWAASTAITAAYAAPQGIPRSELSEAGSAADLMDYALGDGDEHVITPVT